MDDQPSTLTEAAEALRAGRATSVGLTQAALATADRLDGALGVYLARFDEQALAAAERADRELAAGRDRGPLHGIPFGVKDLVAVSDGPTSGQSVVFDSASVAGRNAPVAARLKAAGAVITGKTTTMEFGLGTPDATKPFPVPRNPWDPSAWTGGSSSGTACGVATGMFAAGLGSDTAGSIRMPAAFCGVTGLMPTFGRVPKTGCVPLGYSLDRVGPLARSARDCSAVLGVLAGAHPSDPDSAGAPPFDAPAYDADLRGMRIGVVRDGHFEDGADPALAATFDAAVAVLVERGASVHEVALPYWHEVTTVLFVTTFSEGLAYHRNDLVGRWSDHFATTRGSFAHGVVMSGADYVQAQRVRRVAQEAVARLFADLNAIVCPTASIAAPKLDANGEIDDAAVFPRVPTPYWSVLGNPVVALPIGVNGDGLPLSMQLVGPAYGESTILRAADTYQRATDWHLRVPPTDAPAPASAPREAVAATVGAAPDADAIARAQTLFDVAGLPAAPDEVAALAGISGHLRGAIEALYEVADARDALPALRFQPAARIADWSD